MLDKSIQHLSRLALQVSRAGFFKGEQRTCEGLKKSAIKAMKKYIRRGSVFYRVVEVETSTPLWDKYKYMLQVVSKGYYLGIYGETVGESWKNYKNFRF